MQKYKIFQVKLTKEQIASISNEDNTPVPDWYKDYIDTTMYPDHRKVSKALYLYSHVGNITAKDLNDVYHVGNDPFDNPAVEYLSNPSGRNMHSLTVGDVVEDPDGKKYFVNFAGFGEL